MDPKPKAAVQALPHTGMTIVNDSGNDGKNACRDTSAGNCGVGHTTENLQLRNAAENLLNKPFSGE